MHVIYSALRDLNESAREHPAKDNSEIRLRYLAYIDTCRKHREYIADIQKHFPNWMPPFR